MSPAKRAPSSEPALSLRLLYAEDSPADAELALLCLKNAGIEAAVDLVRTEEEFTENLTACEYDIVLSDYRLGAWTGMRALEIVHEKKRTFPSFWSPAR